MKCMDLIILSKRFFLTWNTGCAQGRYTQISKIFTNTHQSCTFHIIYSFSDCLHKICYRFPSQMLRRNFWNAVCATYPIAFESIMKLIEKIEKSAHECLKNSNQRFGPERSFPNLSS